MFSSVVLPAIGRPNEVDIKSRGIIQKYFSKLNNNQGSLQEFEVKSGGHMFLETLGTLKGQYQFHNPATFFLEITSPLIYKLLIKNGRAYELSYVGKNPTYRFFSKPENTNLHFILEAINALKKSGVAARESLGNHFTIKSIGANKFVMIPKFDSTWFKSLKVSTQGHSLREIEVEFPLDTKSKIEFSNPTKKVSSQELFLPIPKGARIVREN